MGMHNNSSVRERDQTNRHSGGTIVKTNVF